MTNPIRCNPATIALAVAMLTRASPALAQTTRPAPAQAPDTPEGVSRSSVPPPLKVGDMAPPLIVERWCKGTPVTSLTDGKVHVFEFWATWCGFCRHAMPHVSRLAHKWGDKVSVTGVDVWEDQYAKPGQTRADQLANVDAFLARSGKTMDYNVALDNEAGVIANTWLRRAGVRGIPSSWVVDRKGRVVWIGMPGLGLKQVVDAVVAGTDDPQTLSKQYRATLKEWDTARQSLAASLKSKDWAEATILNDRCFALESMDGAWVRNRYIILANTDDAALTAFKADVLAKYGSDPFLLSDVAITAMDGRTVPAGKQDYAFAVRAFDKAFEATELTLAYGQTFAEATAKTGDYQRAAQIQASVVDALEKAGADQKLVAPAREKLAAYRKLAPGT